MPSPNIEVKASGKTRELIVRTGEAPKVYDPRAINLQGNINAPLVYFNSRKEVVKDKENPEPYFKIEETHLVVNRQEGRIVLNANESDPFGAVITGTLEHSPEYLELGINGGKQWSATDLAKKLKSMRYIFSSREVGMAVIADFQTFKAKVNSEINVQKDDRGGKKNSLEVSVDSSLPYTFDIKIPVFRGQPPVSMKIEVELDTNGGHRVDIYLQSIEAQEEEQKQRDSIFETQLEPFQKYGIAIIEI